MSRIRSCHCSADRPDAQRYFLPADVTRLDDAALAGAIARLSRALRRARASAGSIHGDYDPARHRALVEALRAASAARNSRARRTQPGLR